MCSVSVEIKIFHLVQLEKKQSEEMDLSKFPLASEGMEEEEEEEDEEDDDEDVSKYDLMADSDNEPAPRYMSPCIQS